MVYVVTKDGDSYSSFQLSYQSVAIQLVMGVTIRGKNSCSNSCGHLSDLGGPWQGLNDEKVCKMFLV